MRWIDISHVLDQNTPVYPGDPEITLEKVRTLEADSYAAYRLSSCLHTGTHIDIPMHLIEDGRMVMNFRVDCFAGKGVMLDVRGQTCIGMNALYEKAVAEDSVVLLYTGFDERYGTDDYFTNHPCVSAELGDFLLSRKIKILGMDMPAPDYPPFTFHKKLLREGIFVLENLTNLGALAGAEDFEVAAFPLKIAAEASFVRAVCRVSD